MNQSIIINNYKKKKFAYEPNFTEKELLFVKKGDKNV